MTSYDMELYNIIPQRNLTYYMMTHGPGTTPDSRAQALGLDTFKFEPLSNSASNGFTVRIPGRETSATRSDDESFRWDPENGCMPEDELYYGDQNPNMRNTVTLNPLQFPQSTARAYDLNELSRTGNEFAHSPAKDWELKSDDFYSDEQRPTRVVRVTTHSTLHEPVARSENKLRSLQRLKQLSLDDRTARENDVD
jgi:hypothetical protein